MKSLCFSAYVFGSYTKFIPYYIYSILKSYPDCYVKIFTHDHLSEKVKKCLELIRNELSTNFEIKESYYSHLNITRQIGTTLRFIIPYEEFKEFQYVYMGDVDFLIIKENPSLLEAHIEHSKITGLPYSNIIRPNSKRLAALHFFHVETYFQKMNKLINFHNENITNIIEELKKYRGNDEKFLYKLVEDGIGFGTIKDYLYRSHHGFHLGALRVSNNEKGFLRYINNENNLIPYLPEYSLLKRQLLEFFNDHLFNKILNELPIRELKDLNHFLMKY